MPVTDSIDFTIKLKAEMEAREKLQEAGYFLFQLKQFADKEIDFFNYSLSAFLGAWTSVPDIMLYDFAEKYSLGLTREDYVTEKEFRLAAKVLNRQEAIDFAEWLDKRISELRKDHSILFRKRIEVVHRGYPLTTRTYAVNPSGSARIPITSVTPAPPSQATVQWNVEIKTYFQERPNESVIDICQRAYRDMEILVQDAKYEVWKKEVSK